MEPGCVFLDVATREPGCVLLDVATNEPGCALLNVATMEQGCVLLQWNQAVCCNNGTRLCVARCCYNGTRLCAMLYLPSSSGLWASVADSEMEIDLDFIRSLFGIV